MSDRPREVITLDRICTAKNGAVILHTNDSKLVHRRDWIDRRFSPYNQLFLAPIFEAQRCGCGKLTSSFGLHRPDVGLAIRPQKSRPPCVSQERSGKGRTLLMHSFPDSMANHQVLFPPSNITTPAYQPSKSKSKFSRVGRMVLLYTREKRNHTDEKSTNIGEIDRSSTRS